MIYKLITFKLSFRNIVRLFLLFMASNEDLNMKAKKVRTFLYLVSNFLFREHQQKTFVTLSGFWLLMADNDDSVIL